MSELKHRQAIFVKGEFIKWHYWGFIGEQGNLTFVAPETNLSSIEEVYKNSYQYISLKDKNGGHIHRGDYIKWEI